MEDLQAWAQVPGRGRLPHLLEAQQAGEHHAEHAEGQHAAAQRLMNGFECFVVS